MRKLMWFAIGFFLACLLCAYHYHSMYIWLAIPVLLLGVLLAFLTKYAKPLCIAATVLLGIAVGVSWFELFDWGYLRDARSLDGTTKTVSMEAAEYSKETERGGTVTAVLTINNRDYRVRIYINETRVLSPGDVINGSFRFRFTAHGADNEETYHRGDGIFLLAYESSSAKYTTPDNLSARYWPVIWRQQILRRIDSLFPKVGAGFAKALLLGDRSDIDYELNTAFKISGISHVIAVSGLHVSILFSLIYLLTWKKRWLSCLLGIPALFLFAAMASFTPSISRACIMYGLMLIATLFEKDYDPPTALAFAALVLLIINPMCVIDISFQLSVSCLIGIFLFSQKIHDWLLDNRRLGSAKGRGILPRLKRWFAGSVSVSIGASVLTVPITAYHFGTVSLVSPLTNLLVLWLISFIFYGIILACVISMLNIYTGMIVGWLITFPILFVINIAKLLSWIPFAAVYTASSYITVWLVSVYVMLAVFLLMRKKQAFLLAGCIILSLCASLIASWAEPMLDESRITVLNVGQGLCVLLQSEGRSYLVDCGGDSDTESADIAAEMLLSQGIAHLDGLIVTHYDQDHAGGAALLLSRMDTDAVLLPRIDDDSGLKAEILAQAGTSATLVDSDMKISFGNAALTIFRPEQLDSGNENSLCVLFQSETCDILITGDRGLLGEKLLLHRVQLPEVDILVAGHHGSAKSTGTDLLEATKPEYVFISVGVNNQYDHPSQALLERLEEFGCIVYRTDQCGTITYRG